jgi:hypothetical protein
MKLRLAALALFLMLGIAPAFGQGCSMCASSAEGAGAEGRSALLRGVAVLLLPPIGIMAALVGVAFRYRREHDGPEEDDLP